MPGGAGLAGRVSDHFAPWEPAPGNVVRAGVVYIGTDGMLGVGSFCVLGSEHGPLELGSDALIRSHTVVEGDVRVGRRFRCGHHALIRHGVSIGDDVKVGSYASLEGGVTVQRGAEIGGRVQMGSQYPDGMRLVVGEGARIYLGARFLDNRQPPDGPFEPAFVGRRAIVGAGALVLPGVVIHDDAMVAAGAIVDRDVPPGMLLKRDRSMVARR